MNKNIVWGIIVVVIIAGGAYMLLADRQESDTATNPAPVNSGENSNPSGSVHNQPVEPAAAAARKDLAEKLDIEEKDIVIMQITDTTWNNGCLGLAGPDEMCTEALVPGFKVEMDVQGEPYIYRTDKTGAVVRAENQ